MSFEAIVYRVMIASPSDILQERHIIRETVHEWNSVHGDHRGIFLQPIGWETDIAPLMGDRPQALINRQLLESADLLVGVFWTRIGTPTGEDISGSVEEIRKHLKTQKPALLYFSSAPVAPASLDPNQYKLLTEFKKECQGLGLYESFSSSEQFQKLFTKHLAMTINDKAEFFSGATQSQPELNNEAILVENPVQDMADALSSEAKEMLIAALADPGGEIKNIKTLGGSLLGTPKRRFLEPGADGREVAIWEGALEELVSLDLIRDVGYNGQIFRLTRTGYDVADVVK